MFQRKRCACGNNVESKGRSRVTGKVLYRTICTSCRRKKLTRSKKVSCQQCGFVPVHPCQLDIDHIDGNSENNAQSNLQTLCANCHRLKTVRNRDFVAVRRVSRNTRCLFE